MGLLSFVDLFGFEKSILAVFLGLKALSTQPPPHSTPDGNGQIRHRTRRRSNCAGGDHYSVNLDRIPKLIAAFRALSDGF